MSDCFKITSASGAYFVEVGTGLLNSVMDAKSDSIILCDKRFLDFLTPKNHLILPLEASETSKSLDRMPEFIMAMKAMGAGRSTQILAIGGGIIQDIATFVASSYMRGLTWDYVPTTLLGMVDSCIGGKSSINVGLYKNLVGNFHPPRRVYVDVDFANTLDPSQKISGLCEAVKICYAKGAPELRSYLEMNPAAMTGSSNLINLVKLSLLTKRWFIEIDEHDKNERLLLNFGHTFGHAIEGSCDYQIPHGLAVGLGMLAAIECSRATGWLVGEPIMTNLLESHVRDILGSLPEMNALVSTVSRADLLDRFESDKKHGASHYTVIAPGLNSTLTRFELPKNSTSRDLIFKSISSALNGWR